MLESRYSRLERYAPIGGTLSSWQEATIAVVGCGGLGGGLIQLLARMGAASVGQGRLTLIDRDTVGWENLGHQALFVEADAANGLPKAIAAANSVARLNSMVRVEAHVASLDRHNIQELLSGAELIFDGLDSYATRLLLNDYALATGTPYFYAGVVRGELSARAVVPGVTGCLRCILETPPAPGEIPTCAAEGVFPPLLAMANLLQLDAANRALAGQFQVADDLLYSFDMSDLTLRKLALRGPLPGCPACSGRFDYLTGQLGHTAAHACAADRVELDLAAQFLSLDKLELLLAASDRFELKRNDWCLIAESQGLRYTIFPSGKLVLTGSGELVDLERFAATYLGV